LIELLKSRGLEDLVYFNEKSCCNEIEKMFLKALKYVSMIYPTKCELWYRNFLCKKYYVNQPSNMSYTKTHSKHIDERFYKTYLSEKISNKSIPIEMFMSDKNKYLTHHKKYDRLAKITGSKFNYYLETTLSLHQKNKDFEEKIAVEATSFLGATKKIEKFERTGEWDYKLATNRICNPKFFEKSKENS